MFVLGKYNPTHLNARQNTEHCKHYNIQISIITLSTDVIHYMGS